MLKQELLNRLYELIGLEEQRLANNRKFAEVLNEKKNLEKIVRNNETSPKQKYARVLPMLSALCLSIVIAIILFENPYVQLIMCLVFAYPLYLLFAKAFIMVKRIKAKDDSMYFLQNSTYIEELKKDIQKYEIEVEKYETKENEFVEKIKQKAAFLPSSYHILSSFQSLYDYLYYGQAETLGEALHLHEQQVRHEENMKMYQEIVFGQQQANQRLSALQTQLEEKTAVLEQANASLKKEVENLGHEIRNYR
jgi:DNA repair exonuclease SbcCD ATPase subunit